MEENTEKRVDLTLFSEKIQALKDRIATVIDSGPGTDGCPGKRPCVAGGSAGGGKDTACPSGGTLD